MERLNWPEFSRLYCETQDCDEETLHNVLANDKGAFHAAS